MSDYKSACLRYFDQQGIKYTEDNEGAVSVKYNGKNLRTVNILVFFDKDGDNDVHLACWEIASFHGDKYAAGLVACNALNGKYRWVSFFLDDDEDVQAAMDAIVDSQTVGEECLQLVKRMVGIIDGAYPELMKALYA